MKRLLRWAFHLSAVVSAVLLAAVCVLWVRDRTGGDTWILRNSSGPSPAGSPQVMTFAQAWSSGGGLRVMLGRFRWDPADAVANPPGPAFNHGSYDPGPDPYPVNRFDGRALTVGRFEYFWKDYATPGYSEWQRSVTLPNWAAALLTALAPLAVTVRLLRRSTMKVIQRRRARAGRCLRCGYDLTGNTSGKCSECGTEVKAAPVVRQPRFDGRPA